MVRPTIAKHMLADGFELVLDLRKSHGSWVHDSQSNRDFLDLFSFFGSLPLGMNHPRLMEPEFMKFLAEVAVNKPSNSDFYTEEMAVFVDTFAETVIPRSHPYLFFVDGGALGVENALKAAFDWKVRKNLAAGRGEIGSRVIHFKHAFHGRTGYTLSLTNTADPRKYKYFEIRLAQDRQPRRHVPPREAPGADRGFREGRPCPDRRGHLLVRPRHRLPARRAYPGRGRRQALQARVPRRAPQACE